MSGPNPPDPELVGQLPGQGVNGYPQPAGGIFTRGCVGNGRLRRIHIFHGLDADRQGFAATEDLERQRVSDSLMSDLIPQLLRGEQPPAVEGRDHIPRMQARLRCRAVGQYGFHNDPLVHAADQLMKVRVVAHRMNFHS